MLKINIKTKVGYRPININPENIVYYRKTKKGYSKKSEKIIKDIHEKIIEKRVIERYKQKIIEIKEYQKKKRELKKEKRELKKRELKKRELIKEEKKEPIKYFYNWLCTCDVSDRIFNHIFGVSNLIGSDEEYVIREHEKYYPDHILKNIEMFDMSGESQKELHEELEKRKKYITKTEGIHFYD